MRHPLSRGTRFFAAGIAVSYSQTENMGNTNRKEKRQNEVAYVPPGMDLRKGNDGKIYSLRQSQPGCTRCTFWSADPRTNRIDLVTHGSEYPRDRAVLRGMPIRHPETGSPWLVVTHYAQNAGRGGWKYAPEGAAMPFQGKKFMLNEVIMEQQKRPGVAVS